MAFLFALPIRQGTQINDEQLSECIDQYGKLILRIAYAYTKDRQLAEDVCQDVYIKFCCESKRFQDDSHEKAWLIRVTINRCKDICKSAWNRRVQTKGDDMPEESRWDDDPGVISEKDERARFIFSQVSLLKAPFKAVIILYYYEDLSTREIAQALKIPESTVRSRLKRAREKLKTIMEGGAGAWIELKTN